MLLAVPGTEHPQLPPDPVPVPTRPHAPDSYRTVEGCAALEHRAHGTDRAEGKDRQAPRGSKTSGETKHSPSCTLPHLGRG